MFFTIWIANQAIPWTTALAQSVDLTGGASQIAALDQGGCPITYLFTQLFTRDNMLGFAVIGIIYVICMIFTVRLSEISTFVTDKGDKNEQHYRECPQ